MTQILSDAWFAGFADGEGCFGAYRARHYAGGREYVQPRFIILLRADDVGILEELASAFGGKVDIKRRPQSAPKGAKPCARWSVADKESLARLVAYFDRFPLRAKKARDYEVWREIVCLYTARGGGSARNGAEEFDQMETLRQSLVAGRVYMPQIEMEAA